MIKNDNKETQKSKYIFCKKRKTYVVKIFLLYRYAELICSKRLRKQMTNENSILCIYYQYKDKKNNMFIIYHRD